MEEKKQQPKTRRRRRGKPGSVEDARALLWEALKKAGDMLEAEDLTPDMTLRLLHGISQGAGSYARIVEVSDLAARIEALEAAQEGEGSPDAGPRLPGQGAA